MSLFRKLSVIFTSLYVVSSHGAQAELQLENWKVYGQLAEQSAICASFSKLMEAQSVINPDLGDLWHERRKFAGAVIRKAVFMELNRESSEAEIDNLIASYRDWVLSSLMINHNNKPNKSRDVSEKSEDSGHNISVLMNSQCKNLFKQGDEIIREQRPDLAYLLQNGSETQVKPQDKRPAKTPLVKADQTVNQRPSSAGKALELSIGGGSNLLLKLPGEKPSFSSKEPLRSESKHAEIKAKNLNGALPTKLAQIKSPTPRPDQIKQRKNTRATPPSRSHAKVQSIETELAVERLSKLLEQQAEANMNLTVPKQSANKQPEQKLGNYFAQLGAFAQLENAKAEKNHLESKFSVLFAKLPLHISEITGSGPRFYRIQTSSLSQKHVKTLCDMLWPHKISCLAKR